MSSSWARSKASTTTRRSGGLAIGQLLAETEGTMAFLPERVSRQDGRVLQEAVMADPKFRVGFLLFPNLTQLDLTGPYEVLAKLPGAEVHLIWKTRQPVKSDGVLAIVPTTTFADCPPLDLICVPGGSGMNALL